MHLKSIKNNRKITTSNRLDLETPASWPIMPKISPGPDTDEVAVALGDFSKSQLPKGWCMYILMLQYYCGSYLICKSSFFEQVKWSASKSRSIPTSRLPAVQRRLIASQDDWIHQRCTGWSHWSSDFSKQFLKGAALASISGVTKPWLDDCAEF
jgi:hypothetical protein